MVLKIFKKILLWTLGVLLFLILAFWIFINTDFGQNWIARKVTNRLSKDLHTKVNIKHVDFSLFNKMHLEGLMIEDQKGDTLIYAGDAKLRITDWFFFKKNIELKYIGLDDAVIKFQRTDSVWSQQFLFDYFSGGNSSNTKKQSNTKLDLKKIELNNVSFSQIDKWKGHDMTIQLGQLDLDAQKIDLATKKAVINSINIDKPFIWLNDYTGVDTLKVTQQQKQKVATVDSLLKWNKGGWAININQLNITNGIFKNDKAGSVATTYFDGRHIEFAQAAINMKNVQWLKDTITADLSISTKERSGFEVKKFLANAKFTPQEMAFSNLNIETNQSTIHHFFRMSYDNMDDLGSFIHKVKLEGNFEDSKIYSDDIAFFAPALKTWKKVFQVKGKVNGTIDALKGSGMYVRTDGGTLLDGDISLTGLPDINETFIDLKANNARTTYSDALALAPSIRHITTPDIRKLQFVDFSGNFTGFIKDFVANGIIHTNLGTLKTDLNIKLPKGKEPIYSGTLAAEYFKIGSLLNDNSLGATSFNVQLLGSGFSAKNRNTTINGNVDFIDYKGYRYKKINVKGNLDKNLFAGTASIDDENVAINNINGIVDLNNLNPHYNIKGDVTKLFLKNLGITSDDLSFKGKVDFNFSGSNLDNISGTAKLNAAELSKDGNLLPFDSLVIKSNNLENGKELLIQSNEFKANISGTYKINELADGFTWMLNKYYPTYIKAPKNIPQNQDINFDISTYYFEDYVHLIHPKLSGFNNSHFTGHLNTSNEAFSMQNNIPQFNWGQYSFDEVVLNATGGPEKLNLIGEARNFRLNDSLNFPLVNFTINASKDSSHISLQTGATQALEKANINAWVITNNNGVSINLEPSDFTINGKKWTSEPNGKLIFQNNNPVSGSLVFNEGDDKTGRQKIAINTIPSSKNKSNDISVALSNLNLGDFGPYILPHNRLVGSVSGNILIQNLFDSLQIVSDDIRTKDLQLDKDSLGEVLATVKYNHLKKELAFKGNTLNQDNYLGFDGKIIIGDDQKAKLNNQILINAKKYQIKVLERFLGGLFSDMQGYLTGDIKLKGEFDNLAVTGKGNLYDAGMKVNFTQCYYKIHDTTISITPEKINLDGLVLTDTVTKNPIYIRGGIEHESFKNMFYNLDVTTQKPKTIGKEFNKPVLLLNTTIKDNKQFYGKAYGTGSFSLLGPQSEMFMDIDAVGQAFGKDSSHIVIPPSNNRETGEADFLVERKFGREMADIDAPTSSSNIIYNVKVTATPSVNLEVQIDELTGDIIKGRGNGTLNIISGTAEPMQMRGRFDIDEGSYLFTFQSFFKKPFELKRGSENYIEWNGDPYNAIVNLTATYTANRVSYAPLKNSLPSLDDKVASAYSDVYVVAKLTDQLFSPKIEFSLDFPPTSVAVNDPGLAFGLEQLQKNANELQKQATYLVVFGSFAPVELTAKNSIQEITNSLSGIFFGVINEQIKKVISEIFNSPKYSINFNSSVYNRNVITQGTGLNVGSDVNLTIGRSFLNDRVIISVGGTVEGLNLVQNTAIQQEAQGLLNANLEILLNPAGTFRANLFFRQNTDYLTTSTTGPGRANKYGAGLTYRKEADNFWRLFFKKKREKAKKEPEIELKSEKK